MIALSPLSAQAAAPTWGQALLLQLELRPTLVDYELPGHPRELGRGHAGVIGEARLVWQLDDHVTVSAGALGRLPFAHDFEEELGAFPLFSVDVRPFGDSLLLRFGSLDLRHGFHPALLDEARYAYGRPYAELYDRSLVPEARRHLDGDPFLPVENGAQVIAQVEHLRAEVYLDWQLLETSAHREKFAVGLLGELTTRWVDAGFQLRLVHYGGQLQTQSDPIRASGLDPKRQPTSFAVTVKPRPVQLKFLTVELPAAFVQGRVPQTPGARETTHRGLELGADAILLDVLRLGYRAWLPEDGAARSVSEDGDPVYAGPRAHRVSIGATSTFGPAELAGRLDLVFAKGANKVQYLTVTTLTVRFEHLLFSDVPAP